jgi:hypothetical protein
MPNKTKAAKNGQSPRHPDQTDKFAVLVFKMGDTVPRKLWYDSPIDALTAAVEYLKKGFQARLSDGAVRYFEALPREESDKIGAPKFVAPGGAS